MKLFSIFCFVLRLRAHTYIHTHTHTHTFFLFLFLFIFFSFFAFFLPFSIINTHTHTHTQQKTNKKQNKNRKQQQKNKINHKHLPDDGACVEVVTTPTGHKALLARTPHRISIQLWTVASSEKSSTWMVTTTDPEDTVTGPSCAPVASKTRVRMLTPNAVNWPPLYTLKSAAYVALAK